MLRWRRRFVARAIATSCKELVWRKTVCVGQPQGSESMAAAHVASCRRRAIAAGWMVGSAIALAVTVDESIAADTQPASIADAVRPNPLLSIDRNRATVVERIVATWGDALAQ